MIFFKCTRVYFKIEHELFFRNFIGFPFASAQYLPTVTVTYFYVLNLHLLCSEIASTTYIT